MATGYLGAPEIEVSIANQEVVPKSPESWTFGYVFYKFSFINRDACLVRINNGNPIYLDADQGFECAKGDPVIESFVIVDSDVEFFWLGTY